MGAKWVLHIKRNADGHISRFKARLVAKGFTQIPGQDFTYTFAPLARWDSIRTLLAIAASQDLHLRHIDIKTAFLNGPLDEEIYMRAPEFAGSGIWKLQKGLYGLKQAGRQWYLTFNEKYTTLGFKRLETDWSVHVRQKNDIKSMSTTSVDDILLGTLDEDESDSITKELSGIFDITDNGEVEHLLGCVVIRYRSRRTIILSQTLFTTSILRQFGMEHSNAVSTPLPPKTHLTADDCPKTDEERAEMASVPYCAVVGKVMYLANTTRPDLSFAVRELAKFMSNYGKAHWDAAKHLLRYLQGTRSLGLVLGNVDEPYPIFRGFSDSDWAGGEERKSISGFMMVIGNSPVVWCSRQQVVVALSSCEAEYLALTQAACEAMWMRQFLGELGFPTQGPTKIYCDNNGAIACAHDPHGHTKMKHIDIRLHFLRDYVNKGIIEVLRVDGKENRADLLTKALGRAMHKEAIEMLGMHGSGQGGVSDGAPTV